MSIKTRGSILIGTLDALDYFQATYDVVHGCKEPRNLCFSTL